MVLFDWDDIKNLINQQKHGISFEEAKTVFRDEEALIRDDIEHSYDEERFQILGFSSAARMLVVCHCYRENENVIRIISARKATSKEKETYYLRMYM